MKNKICTQCGFENKESANFCKSCGNRLDDIEKSPEEKAEEVKQKLKETASSVKAVSKENLSTFLVLLKPILKVKIIVPVIVIILIITFWKDAIDFYDDYQYKQEQIRKEKLRKERQAEEKIEKEKAEKIRIAKRIEREKRELKREKERLIREKKAEEDRLKKEKARKLEIAKKFGFIQYPEGLFLDADTQLIWQDDASVVSLKLPWMIKKNYDKDKRKQKPTYTNTQGNTADNYCKNLKLAGKSDWRLPSEIELKQLYKKIDELKNVDPYNEYWSNTTCSYHIECAYSIDSRNTEESISNKKNTYRVRCVRDSKKKLEREKNERKMNAFIAKIKKIKKQKRLAKERESRIQREKEKIYIDNKTGLMWEKNQHSYHHRYEISWNRASNYCKKLDYAGYRDWRLPSVKEMQSLSYYSDKYNMYLPVLSNKSTRGYWTNEIKSANRAYCVNKHDVYTYSKKVLEMVRCVRNK